MARSAGVACDGTADSRLGTLKNSRRSGWTADAVAALEAAGATEAQGNALGRALFWSGRLEAAVDAFAWNAERLPDHLTPWDSLGEAYVAVGDTVGSVRACREVLETVGAN